MECHSFNAKRVVVVSSIAAATGFLFWKYLVRSKSRTAVPPVYICNNISDWDSNESLFLQAFKKAKIIGLDCEWVTENDRRKPVALLQLATPSGMCVLLRLCNISPWLIPQNLIELLADSRILKVGVSVCDDARKLLLDYGMLVKGCVDLRYLAQDLPELRESNSLGLRALTTQILGANLKKSVSISCSNWEAETLSTKQITYAAEDAIASAQIFTELVKRRKKWRHVVFFFMFSEFGEVENYLDAPYKKTPNNNQNNQKHRDPVWNEKKYSRPRQRTMYENCQLQAPDGEQLCSCDRKKAEWYVEKGLGEIIDEEPLTVRLKFEPSNRPILDNKYYIQKKQNICVVCGKIGDFYRKLVVPSEYRRYFPDLMKKNLSHDVLLLCVVCHRQSNIFDFKLRDELAEECDAPIGSGIGLKLKVNSKESAVKSAARALTNTKNKIPPYRIEDLLKIVQEHYKVESVTEELLLEASLMEASIINKDYVPHGLKVYQHVCKHGGLIAFESRWRKHFLDSMKPQFLPCMWSVDHNHERLALQVTNKKVNFDTSILGLSSELLSKVQSMDLTQL